jgi:hypothetical protein
LGGTYITETAAGATPDEALKAMLDRFAAEYPSDEAEGYEGWRDPHCKPGYIQVWDKPVTDEAIDWMRGWVEQNPPASLLQASAERARDLSAKYGWEVKPDPFDKFGPWLMFPLACGGWHFFGWVNT